MPAKRTSLQDRVQKDRMSRAISAFVSTPVAGEEPEYPSDETAAVAETAGPVGATGATGPTEPTGAAAPSSGWSRPSAISSSEGASTRLSTMTPISSNGRPITYGNRPLKRSRW